MNAISTMSALLPKADSLPLGRDAIKTLMHVIGNSLRLFTEVRRISHRSTLFDVVTVRIQHIRTDQPLKADRSRHAPVFQSGGVIAAGDGLDLFTAPKNSAPVINVVVWLALIAPPAAIASAMAAMLLLFGTSAIMT